MVKRPAEAGGSTPKKPKQSASSFSPAKTPKREQPRPSPTSRQEQLDADEELARRLAAEEGLVLPQRKSYAAPVDKKPKLAAVRQTETIDLASDDDDDDIVIMGEPAVVDKKPKIQQKPPIAPLFNQPSPAASTSKVKLEDPTFQPRSPSSRPPFVKTEHGSSFFSTLKAEDKPTVATSRFIAEKPLDTSVYEFDPATDVDTSKWPSGRMPYSYLTHAFVIISATKSRLIISRSLTNLLRTVIELDPDSLEAVTYLTTNRLGPSHEKDLELGVGSQVLGGAIKGVSGLTPAALRQLNKLGDPGELRAMRPAGHRLMFPILAGDVAFEAKKNVRLLVQPTPLVCHSVYTTLLGMTKMKGHGSVDRKTATVKKMLVAAQGEEVRFITRTLCANLRIGAVRLTLTSALAKAFCLSRKARVDDGGEADPDDEFWVSRDERARVMKELRGAKQSKSKAKVKEEEERRVEAKMEKAEQLVRRVYARHPHYGHIIKAMVS